MKLKLYILLIISLFGLLTYTIASHIKAFSSAYIYGYPLLIMQETKRVMLSGPTSENQLIHITHFPNHTFRSVVRPNVDTLYTIAWLNLAAEPQVLSVPELGERYYISPFMDAWTNVFASVGTRTTGNQAGEYAIVGPGWSGDLPADINAIHSPTNTVWMIQRIQTNGLDDIAAVTKLQQKFSLASISQWRQGDTTKSYVTDSTPSDKANNPHLALEEMTAAEFFSALAQLLPQQPPLPNDNAVIKELAKIGITPGHYSPATQGWLGQRVANAALRLTRKKLKQYLSKDPIVKNGWTDFHKELGRYGTDYKLRAGVAMTGLGALPAQDALYTNTTFDSTDQSLTGEHRYTLHFAAGQTPPVNAFWSITLYDENGYLVANALKRYALGDRDTLSYNDDGSLDMFLQRTPPSSKISNWLPTPLGKFVLTLRLYAPKPEAIDGSWPLPKVVKQ